MVSAHMQAWHNSLCFPLSLIIFSDLWRMPHFLQPSLVSSAIAFLLRVVTEGIFYCAITFCNMSNGGDGKYLCRLLHQHYDCVSGVTVITKKTFQMSLPTINFFFFKVILILSARSKSTLHFSFNTETPFLSFHFKFKRGSMLMSKSTSLINYLSYAGLSQLQTVTLRQKMK